MARDHQQNPGEDTAAEPRDGVVSEEYPAQLAGFLAGSLLAGYRLETQVGAGGMAVVFRARDERLSRLVALKILAPGLAADSEFRARFIAESRAAAAVDDPHIIPVYEAGEAAGVLFIAMRFVQGGDLRQVLVREGALPPDRAADFISPVASALDAAHRAGLVHRDVKPANVLVDAREDRPDHVYLSDFGVSKGAMSAAGLTGTGVFVGTPDYSAPEQIEGRLVDGRTDQYALACVAYQLLTGVTPFHRDQGMAVLLAHLSQTPPSVVSQRPELPAAVDQVLAKGMAKVPDKRYESCADFADALREALGLTPYHRRGLPTVPPQPPVPSSSPSDVPSPAAAAIAHPDPAAGADSDPRFDAVSDPGGVTVDAVPPEKPVGVAEAPMPMLVTGPDAAGPEADDDARTPGPRWRRPHLRSARKRRDPSPAPVVVAGEAPAAAAPAPAESQSAGDVAAATGSAALASPQPPTAPPDISSLATAAAVTPADLGTPPDLGVAPELDLGSPAADDLDAASDLGAAAESDLGTVTADWGPRSASADGVDVAEAPPITGPDLSVGEIHDDTDAASPTATLLAGEGMPAAAAPAIAESQPAESGLVGHGAEADATTAPPTTGPAGLTDPGAGVGVTAPARHSQRGVADRPSAAPVWIRRHRLPVFALACAILAAAVTLPLVESGGAHSPRGGTPSSRGNSPGAVNSQTYSRVSIDLPVSYKGLVSSLAFDPSGATLAIAAYGVCLWDIATAGCIPGARLTTAYSVAFSPDGDILAAGDDNNGSTYLWNVAAKRLLQATLPDPASEGVDSVAFSPDGKVLAAGDANGRTYLWNVATQKLIATLTDSPSKGVQSVAFSPDGKILAAGDANGRTYLWNVATAKPIVSLADPAGKGVDSVAFSPDGTILAAADVNGRAYLWNTATDKLIAALADSGSKGVESVAFSPDGNVLAAGDANGSSYLWNTATDKPITTLTDPDSDGIDSVAFSPNGKTLATADQNNSGSVYLWHLG
jgi:serine/threonine protein kinase/sugar lactone lactonase YvrE